MTTLYHGSPNATLTYYPGICLTSDRDGAEQYGQHLHEVACDLSQLRVLRIEMSAEELREAIDSQEWPCDRAADIAARVAEGWDAVAYQDVDEAGQPHDCVRLLTRAAWDAATTPRKAEALQTYHEELIATILSAGLESPEQVADLVLDELEQHGIEAARQRLATCAANHETSEDRVVVSDCSPTYRTYTRGTSDALYVGDDPVAAAASLELTGEQFHELLSSDPAE